MQLAPYTNYSTSNSKEEWLSKEEALNALPRAVLRHSNFVLLDGEWRFALDAQDIGLLEKWYLQHEYTDHANWPGSIEEHIANAKGIKEEHAWEGKVVAWYERDFPKPAITSNGAPSMLQLTFGACGYETQVWLNGIALKTIEGEEVHLGEYTSFSYELNEETCSRLTVSQCGLQTQWMQTLHAVNRNRTCIKEAASGIKLIPAQCAVFGLNRWNGTG